MNREYEFSSKNSFYPTWSIGTKACLSGGRGKLFFSFSGKVFSWLLFFTQLYCERLQSGAEVEPKEGWLNREGTSYIVSARYSGDNMNSKILVKMAIRNVKNGTYQQVIF